MHLPQHLLLVASTTATVSYTVSQKEKFSDFKWFWTLLWDSLLVLESSATSAQSSVMSSTGSLHSTESATKSPYWLGTVFTASARPISVKFAPRWLQPPDEPTCVQRRVAIFWSLEHEKNWANGVSVYIRTDGVELTLVFAQTFCYKPRTFPERTENIPV